jgi:sorting nexin-8
MNVATSTPNPTRTTSAFTTHSEQAESTGSTEHIGAHSTVGSSEGGWGGYSGTGMGGEGFGAPAAGGEGNGEAGPVGRSIGGGRVVGNGIEEVITVTTIPEKEGVFLFQHRNYQVTSARRNSQVIRRYSDFVWLLDCLHKRYPFRQLPLLPPKSVASELAPCFHTQT